MTGAALVTAMIDRDYKDVENVAHQLGAQDGLGAYLERLMAQRD